MLNLPEGAREVFKGVRCTIYHWDQPMYDGSVRTFEMVARPPAATIIPVQGGKLVMQEQRQPHRQESFICFPGGWADVEGEEILETAKRELMEETGLGSDDWELWKMAGIHGYVHWDHAIYIARDCRKVGEMKLDGGEQIVNSLVTFDEFLTSIDDPRFRHVDLVADFNRIRNNPAEKEAFQKLLGL